MVGPMRETRTGSFKSGLATTVAIAFMLLETGIDPFEGTYASIHTLLRFWISTAVGSR